MTKTLDEIISEAYNVGYGCGQSGSWLEDVVVEDAKQDIESLIQQRELEMLERCIIIVRDAGAGKYVYDCSESDDCFHDGVEKCANVARSDLFELQDQLQENTPEENK